MSKLDQIYSRTASRSSAQNSYQRDFNDVRRKERNPEEEKVRKILFLVTVVVQASRRRRARRSK